MTIHPILHADMHLFCNPFNLRYSWIENHFESGIVALPKPHVKQEFMDHSSLVIYGNNG